MNSALLLSLRQFMLRRWKLSRKRCISMSKSMFWLTADRRLTSSSKDSKSLPESTTIRTNSLKRDTRRSQLKKGKSVKKLRRVSKTILMESNLNSKLKINQIKKQLTKLKKRMLTCQISTMSSKLRSTIRPSKWLTN